MNDTEEVVHAPSVPHARFLNAAMRALAIDSMKWAAFLGATSLFTAAVWWPEWKRLASAATFTVLVYVPLVFKRERKS